METHHKVGHMQLDSMKLNYDYLVFRPLSPITPHFYGRLLFVLPSFCHPHEDKENKGGNSE